MAEPDKTREKSMGSPIQEQPEDAAIVPYAPEPQSDQGSDLPSQASVEEQIKLLQLKNAIENERWEHRYSKRQETFFLVVFTIGGFITIFTPGNKVLSVIFFAPVIIRAFNISEKFAGLLIEIVSGMVQGGLKTMENRKKEDDL
jgi:hypothetical protein